jgi:YVTN family beta-propeller protein
MGKQRRHNQQLHGWGTVCGLKVKQHPNEEVCRDQYVVIEPGTAIDCCGREILVPREEYFDFRARFLERWREQHEEAGEDEPGPEQSYTLQLCVRYLECPTEEVPALFDECGCDDTACQPNRILESYEFDVLLDRETEIEEPMGVRLDWRCTVNVANAHRIAVDEANERLYVLTSTDPATNQATLAVYSMGNHSLLRSRGIEGRVMDLTLSPDSSRVYISVHREDPHPLQVLVLNGDLDSIREQPLTIPGSNGEDVRLAVAPDGRLYALNINDRKVYAWNNPDSDDATSRLETPTLGASPWGIVVSPDGNWVFVANSGGESISAIDASDLSAVTTIEITGAAPYALAVAETTAGTRLYIADKENNTVRIFGIQPDGTVEPLPASGTSVALGSNSPVDLVASPGGRWLYVLVEDEEGKGHVQVVDAHKVEAEEGADALGPIVPVANAPRELVLADAGRRLYVAFHGPADDEDAGGVAVLDVIEEACEDLFKRVLEPCPECPDTKCVVLATIEDYVYGDKLVDGEPQNGEAQIDNLKGRHT